MPKNSKINRNPSNSLQWISDNEYREEILDADASLSLNPYVKWAKFILTDDQPNGNNERTPLTEFDNLINSGIHMPIKMAEGRIEEGHNLSSPIGVITHLKKEAVDGINRIVGLAAMWLSERTSDIEHLKARLDRGEDVNLSWELGATDKILADDGIWDWVGLHMKATTVVGNPAYQGRTRIIAMAAKNDDNLPDSAFLFIEEGGEEDSEGRTSPRTLRHFPVKDDKGLYVKSKLETALAEAKTSELPESVLRTVITTASALLDKIEGGASLEEISLVSEEAPLENNKTEENTVELEQLKNRVAELETQLADALSALKERETTVASLTTEKETIVAELTELREFKSGVDAEIAKAEKMDAIKVKFAEAKLNKEDAYFTDNAEKLLNLDETSLDFMIAELKIFSEKSAQASQEDNQDGGIPNFTNSDGEVDIHALVEALRNRKSK